MPESKQFFDFDAYSPAEIAVKAETVGVTKARMALLPTSMLGILAGGFIGLGALYYTVVMSDAGLGFAASRVLGGVVFSLGLILVIVGGSALVALVYHFTLHLPPRAQAGRAGVNFMKFFTLNLS